jgi:hypothetical protein
VFHVKHPGTAPLAGVSFIVLPAPTETVTLVSNGTAQTACLLSAYSPRLRYRFNTNCSANVNPTVTSPRNSDTEPT